MILSPCPFLCFSILFIHRITCFFFWRNPEEAALERAASPGDAASWSRAPPLPARMNFPNAECNVVLFWKALWQSPTGTLLGLPPPIELPRLAVHGSARASAPLCLQTEPPEATPPFSQSLDSETMKQLADSPLLTVFDLAARCFGSLAGRWSA